MQNTNNIDGYDKIHFIVTGNEQFNFNTSYNVAYFVQSTIANVKKTNIISVVCTHFTYGDSKTILTINDGEFSFATSQAGVTIGQVLFKNTSAFTSRDEAIAWFKEQYANGTPVTITVYIKQD